MKRFYFLIVAIAYFFVLRSQQDAQFNLYQFNPLIINPAYAGSRDAISAALNVRSQWVGMDGAPKTNVLSVHSPILDKNVGVGLTIINDRMGPRNMTGVSGNFAYIAKLNQQWKLSMGLNMGYNRFQFNYSEITFKYADATSNLSDFNRGALDVNAGLYLRSKSFFFGFSATHIRAKNIIDIVDTATGNNYSYRLRTHNFITAGKSFVLNEDVVFAPTIMLRWVSGSKGTGNADLNLNFFLYNKLWLGVFVRGGYGPGFLMQYYINPNFKAGYSYDMGLRDARRLGPSHEVTLSYEFINNKAKIVSPRFL